MKGKLVRDNIPKIIEREGKKARTKILSRAVFKKKLLAKLVEESREAQSAKGVRLVEELADIEEVLAEIRTAFIISAPRIRAMRLQKKKQRGGFSKRIFLLN